MHLKIGEFPQACGGLFLTQAALQGQGLTALQRHLPLQQDSDCFEALSESKTVHTELVSGKTKPSGAQSYTGNGKCTLS